MGEPARQDPEPFRSTARISRAIEMVAAQAQSDVEQASALMREIADTSQITVEQVAQSVIDGSLRFDQ